MKNGVVLALVLLLKAVGPCALATPPSPIIKFAEVSKNGIYRGAAPGEPGVAWLAQNHFKTILDLRIESPKEMYEEYKQAASLGMHYVAVPMDPAVKPRDKDINYIENVLLQNKSLQPIFVHCRQGEDRTGLVIALYRVFTQGMAPQDAYQEMLNFGFHTWLENISRYFSMKTGFIPLVETIAK